MLKTQTQPPPCSSSTHPSSALYLSFHPFLSKHSSNHLSSLYFSITSCLLSSSLHASICVPPQRDRVQHPPDVHQWLISSHFVVPAAHSLTENWSQLNTLRKSQGFYDGFMMMSLWVCVRVYIWVRNGSERWFPVKRVKRRLACRPSLWLTDELQHTWSSSKNQWCPNIIQSVLRPKHQILPPGFH